MAMFGARIRDLTPEGYAGRLQGVRIFSQVLVPGIVGPYIGKTILANAEMIVNNDGTQSFVPNANIFLGALVAIIPVIIVVYGLKRKKIRHNKRQNLLTKEIYKTDKNIPDKTHKSALSGFCIFIGILPGRCLCFAL